MRKKLTAVVLAVLVFALIAASAASLGGVNTANVGADVGVVASCDTDGVDVSYTFTFNGTEYVIDTMTISGIDTTSGTPPVGCVGSEMNVTLDDGTGTGPEFTVGSIAGSSETITGVNYSAAALTDIAIVIHG